MSGQNHPKDTNNHSSQGRSNRKQSIPAYASSNGAPSSVGNKSNHLPATKAGLRKIFGTAAPVGRDDVLQKSLMKEDDQVLLQKGDDDGHSHVHILSLPENVLENLFTFLDLSDLKNCALVCTEWGRVLSDENNDVWRSHCFRKMSREVIYSDLLAPLLSFKSKLRAFHYAWNPNDCSRNIFIKPNGFTLHRNPVAQSTDGSRGKIGTND